MTRLRPYRSSRALVVALEGADGTGKTTQASLLANTAAVSGYRAARLPAPTPGFAFYDQIREWLRSGLALRYPVAFQGMMAANRVDWQARAMEEVLRIYDLLVMDRSNASAWVYGTATGLEPECVEAFLEPVVIPDMTFVLDVPTWTRYPAGTPDGPPVKVDSYDADEKLQESVRQLYREWVGSRRLTDLGRYCSEYASLVTAKDDPGAICRDAIWPVVASNLPAPPPARATRGGSTGGTSGSW